MPSVASARATVNAVTGATAVLNVGSTEELSQGEATLEVESFDDGYTAAMARATPQVSAFEILIDGFALDMSDVTGDISVSRSYDRRLQEWTFQLILSTPTGPLGSPFNCIGPPTGKRKVTVNGVYKILSGANAGTVVKVPIITDGIADSSRRDADGSGTFTETISGVCRGGRYDQEVVTIILPPGHGFPRGRVLGLLANRAGETQTRLEDGNRMLKEVQVVDGDWLAVGAEIQEVENRRVYWDAEGYLVNTKIGRIRSEESSFVDLDERDWLDLAVVSVEHKADVLTDVTVTGTEQIEDGHCGIETIPQEVFTRADYARATPAYSFGGVSFVANPLNPDAVVEDRLVQLIRYRQTLKCGVVVYERTETYKWKNPLAIRHTYQTGTGWVAEANVWTDDNLSASHELAWQYGIEQWTPFSIEEAWHYWYQDGYVHPLQVVSSDDPIAWLQGQYGHTINAAGEWVGDYVGLYLGSKSRSYSYTFPRKAVYSRDVSIAPPFDSWEDLEPDNGVEIIGDEGVASGASLPFTDPLMQYAAGGITRGEGLIPVDQTYKLVYATADGYKEREVSVSSGWGHTPIGVGGYKYGKGDESNEAEDTFQDLAREETVYISTGENHKKITSKYQFGKFVESDTEPGLPGQPPAADRMETYEWPTDEYESEEEFQEFAALAKRSKTKQIKVQVTADGLLTCHTAGVLKTDSAWAENEDELEAICKFLIDESLAATVQGTILFNAFIREAMVIRARMRPLLLDHDVRVESVTHSGPPEGPITTAITAKLYGGLG